jgi:hypothetical protein
MMDSEGAERPGMAGMPPKPKVEPPGRDPARMPPKPRIEILGWRPLSLRDGSCGVVDEWAVPPSRSSLKPFDMLPLLWSWEPST